jgi:hypothetical protein
MATDRNVFISYASDTKPLAEELTRALESHGIEPWVDFKDLQPGQRRREEVERAIDAAQWIVILVRPDSRATPWQEAEWGAALAGTWADSDKKLLPIIFGQSDPPPFLRYWVPLKIDPDAERSTWTSLVLDTLGNIHDDRFQGRSPANREERIKRFEKIQAAAEELRDAKPDEPPAKPA